MRLLAVGITFLTIYSASATEAVETKYYTGTIQPTSLDGKTSFGPDYPSTIRRRVNFDQGIIGECVFQKGQLYVTQLNRTAASLVFSAIDRAKSFSGFLIFSDETLSSWSYDITVRSPNPGRITGQLPEYGASTNAAGTLIIKKVWENQVLITETYKPATKADYDLAIVKYALPVYPECR